MLSAFTVLAGCGGAAAGGGSTPPITIAKGTVADLRGGWLLTSTMPFGTFPTSASSFGLSLSLDVIGGQVVGTGSIAYPCIVIGTSGSAVGGGLILEPANVADDGSFTLTDKLLTGTTQHQLILSGHVPATAGGVWSGSYTASSSSGSCNGTPPPAQAGSFSAQKIANLTGTYVGHGTLAGTTSPATVTAILRQGTSTSINGILPNINDQSAVTGTLQIQGFPCFTSGTVRTQLGVPLGWVSGNAVSLQLTMDDGSSGFLIAKESEITATTLTTAVFSVSGGSCNGSGILFGDFKRQ